MKARLQAEIRQSKPFSSLEEEAILNLGRTASVVDQSLAAALRPHGLSGTQYNVLRILRGAGPPGLRCQEIALRMVARDPDITRLVDRLEARKLCERTRSREDRRVVRVRITVAGSRLLASLDASMAKLPAAILGHLGRRRLKVLIALLEMARERPGTNSSRGIP